VAGSHSDLAFGAMIVMLMGGTVVALFTVHVGNRSVSVSGQTMRYGYRARGSFIHTDDIT